MNKAEIEEAIKNGESVWGLCLGDTEIEKLCFLEDNNYEFENTNILFGITEPFLVINKCWYYPLEKLYKTKEEAEHCLYHTNITRTEELPFLTWEVFLEEKKLYFYDFGRVLNKLFIYNNKIILSQAPDSGDWDVLKPMRSWDLTEQNFYKAYDECVKLFKGEK